MHGLCSAWAGRQYEGRKLHWVTVDVLFRKPVPTLLFKCLYQYIPTLPNASKRIGVPLTNFVFLDILGEFVWQNEHSLYFLKNLAFFVLKFDSKTSFI